MEKEDIIRTCSALYKRAKIKKPNKPESHRLRIVLIAQKPFDFQQESLIDDVLEKCPTIELLIEYILEHVDDESLHSLRRNNIKNMPMIKEENEKFSYYFWRE